MLLLYIFLGIILSVTGALPLGASNIAVITTAKISESKSIKIAQGAGFGEVLLAFFALWYSQIIYNYFEMNTWIQLSFIALFFIVGIGFLLSKKIEFNFKIKLKNKGKLSSYVTGFLLAFLNPPVLLFWIIGISLVQKYALPISNMSSILVIGLFLSGVYLGKYFTLFLYGKLGSTLGKKSSSKSQKMHQYIGVALLLFSTIQGIRYLI